MITYRYSAPSDFECIFDTANRIFSLCTNEDGSVWYDKNYFRCLQPKLYQSAEQMPPHLLAFDGNTLVGMAAVRIHPLWLGSRKISMGGVGTVGVLQEYRRRGIMSELMNRVNADMAAQGVDLGELGGKRARYAHFGYATGGSGMELTIIRDDVARFSSGGYEIQEITGEAGRDESRLYLSLYEKNAVHAYRTERDFLLTLRSGKRRPYRIIRNGKITGYLCANPGLEAICELETENLQELPQLLCAYLNAVEKSSVLLYGIAPTEFEKLSVLLPIATSAKLAEGERYRIFDFRHLLEEGLRGKAELMPLAEGSMRVAIEGYGTLMLEVGNEIRVLRSDAAAEVHITGDEAVHLFLGLAPQCGWFHKTLPPQAHAWFPLPLHNRPCDRI